MMAIRMRVVIDLLVIAIVMIMIVNDAGDDYGSVGAQCMSAHS